MRNPARGGARDDLAGGLDHGENNRPETDRQEAKKPTYAPIPARALADIRLSALDLRVLATVATHDRFGKNGAGCYASHLTLAALVQCHLKSLSRCLKALGGYGYVEARPHPLTKRRMYCVVYNDEDKAALKKPKGNETVTPEGNELVTPEGNETVPSDASAGNRGGYPKEIELSSEEIARSAKESAAEAAPSAPAMKKDTHESEGTTRTRAREAEPAVPHDADAYDSEMWR